MAYQSKYTALVEALKEGLRIALFAGVTALVAWASKELELMDPTSTFYIVGTMGLRLVDKFIHEDDTNDLKGLSPL